MNTITKAERAARIERAQALLLAAGWPSISERVTLEIDAALRGEFALGDRRSARSLRAAAVRALRDEAQPEIGRPRQVVTLRAGDKIELIPIVGGEAADCWRCTVEMHAGTVYLTSDERDTLMLRKITE